MSDALFDHQNVGYVQLLYEEFQKNPDSVPEAWRAFFNRGPEALAREGILVSEGFSPPVSDFLAQAPTPTEPGVPPDSTDRKTEKLLPVVARAAGFIQAFRDHGHQLARLDPLGSKPPGHPQLEPSFFGTTREELEEIPASVIDARWGDEPLARVLKRLEEAYCGSIGYQFEHLEDPEKVRWLWEQVETGVHTSPLDDQEKKDLLKRLSEVEGMEHFLHRAYLGQKRFSLEGTDMMVPVLDQTIREASRYGGNEVVLGMAHRGRLNVLAHLVGVEYEQILRGFEGKAITDPSMSVPRQGTGDVKYHHGAEGDFQLSDGSSVKVTLVPNPSHLEFVNPVVEGIVRSRQFGGPEKTREQDLDIVIPILIHGDAAFAAEGIVAETLNLARLAGYDTGGTVHIIVNNQVGFTTDPSESRSTRYSSDLAKGYDVPVIHVNADDPEACLAAVRLAAAFRARFHDDIVIDLIGYRRHGHNEGDEPAYTQPRQYQVINAHPTVRTIWAEHLLEAGVLEEGEADALKEEVVDRLRQAQDRVREAGDAEAADPQVEEEEPPTEVDTRVPLEDLIRLNAASMARPEGFRVHPKLDRQLNKRLEDFGADSTLEWAHAETLAFASLLEENFPVRLTGQDSERGTFSQRHLVLHDVETGDEHIPLAEVGTARFEVYNSPLSETAVVGFEYGYEVGSAPDLVLWEAQFGDFVNVAQVMIDQFIASGRAKWGQLSRLTLLLPHGHEGQGPEHTSARLERFLQLSAEDNMRVAYPTTPAQYFHLLRRQAVCPSARPLVVMTPKSLLRHPRATSRLRELAEGAFHPVLPDPESLMEAKEGITRLVLCSGKIYYDLATHPKREELGHVGLARIEELFPFPADDMGGLVGSFPNLSEVIWVQEEPMNQGALSYIGPRLRAVVPRKIPLRHVARPDRASPAEGKNQDHVREQKRIVEEALGVGRK